MDEINQNPHSNPPTEAVPAELSPRGEAEPGPSLPEDQPLEGLETSAPPGMASLRPAEPPAGSIRLLERHWRLILVAVLLLATVLRTRGLNWDEGQHLHPDERFLTMVGSAIRLPVSAGEYFDTAASPLNPYNNNFSSFVYGTAPLFFARLVAQLVDMADYESLALLGRALSALADVFVAAMVFAIGRRLYGLRAGLLAGLSYALAVLPIKQSHFFTVDTFTNVPLMLAFWFTLDIVEGRRGWRSFALAGIFFGLMLASRINLAPFLAILVLAGLLRLLRSLEAVPQIHIRRGSETLMPPPARDAQESDGIPAMRAYRLGPFLIEIEFKAPSPAAGGAGQGESLAGIWPSLRTILLGLVIAVVAAVLIFRVAQPYAFEGLFKLNPQYLEDMARVQRLVSGQDDYPPGHQWTNRMPYWFFWYNVVFWGLGPALGFAAWLGVALAAYQILRHRRWEHLLILLWVLGIFFYHGQQLVMTMRYLMPLYPFLAIFAGFFLVEVWEQAGALRETTPGRRMASSAPFFAAGLLAVVIGATAFWALASTSIYTRTNTRVAASRWIYENVAEGEVIANEHWDDSLPLRVDGRDYFRDHQGVMLELYGEDTPEKRELMIQWMDQTNYIILSSNRLYGSIPRLPMRFPLTTRYYEWLFNGQLGFEQVKEFTSYPQFLGITIVDDNAEEAFTVYDHPKVIIFRKTPAYSHDHIVKLFNSVDLSEVLRLRPVDATASRRQFRMNAVELAANRAGGTWSDIFDRGDMANRFPVLVWLGMVWLIGILAFPFTFLIFHSFVDRGYAFARALGILFISWFAWLLGSYHILPFGRLPILLGLIALIVAAILILRSRAPEFRSFIRSHFAVLLMEELVFLVFFAIDLYIRYRNPDLWHPWLGGERPMDFAFLNAVVKTTYFPPYNPWFAGSYINYYYFGQLISATLVRLSGITTEIAYNLLIPLFFGLTASGAFGAVFNLVHSGRRRRALNAGEAARNDLLRPGLAGVFGVILVQFIGNLGEIKLAAQGLRDLGGGPGLPALLNGLNRWLVDGETIPVRIGDWYWTATRVIPNTINEFPFFTFIYGDLHAHLMAIPYALLALGLAAHTLLSRNELKWYSVGVIALTLGALRAINTWDYPTYLAIVGAAIILKLGESWRQQDAAASFQWKDWLQQWLRFILVAFLQIMLVMIPLNMLRIRVTVELAVYLVLLSVGAVLGLNRAGRLWDPYQFLRRFGWQFLAILVLSVVLFLPYMLNYATGYASVTLWKDVRTTFGEYLTVHGIFLFLAATFLIVVLLTDYLNGNTPERAGFELTGWAVYFLPALVIASILLVVLKLSILALVLPLVGLGVWIILHRKTPIEAAWVTLLVLAGLLLTLLVEYIVLKGDIGRMNTVFKFYLQAWVLLAVAGAAGLGLIIDDLSLVRRWTIPAAAAPLQAGPAATVGSAGQARSRNLRRAWWGAFLLLVLAGLTYPVAAARAKMDDRYIPGAPAGLNGMDYMQQATYNENNQELALHWDWDAIEWMRQNIKGSPVIMEANTGLYRWGNRYSIYTGLPTVIGWDWHTKQQYSLLPGDLIDYRVSVVREFYNTTDQARAMQIARRYQVSYVVVGGLERAVYDPNGVSKFDQAGERWSLVYQNEQVKIYQLR